VALLLFAVSVLGSRLITAGSTVPPPWWVAFLLSGISCTALLFHRGHPRATVVLTAACAVAAVVLGHLLTVLSLGPLMVALYSFALRTERNAVRRVYVIGVAALLVTTELIAGPDNGSLDLKTIGPVAWVLLPTALGSSSRLRRAYLDAMRARLEHVERTREEEACHRVDEERMRIARELHDVTAHHLALANAQAGTVAHLMRTRPDQAHRILADLAATTSAALRELKATVGLLRQPDAPDMSPAVAPGLAGLADLTAALRSAGLTVLVVTEGVPRQLSPGADHTAFRIVQEALTNVTKHAAADEACIRLAYSRDGLTITVMDDGGGDTALSGRAKPPAPGSGFGLIGMRERAQSVGGRLRAGPRPGGGFEVTAELPLHPDGLEEGPVL